MSANTETLERIATGILFAILNDQPDKFAEFASQVDAIQAGGLRLGRRKETR